MSQARAQIRLFSLVSPFGLLPVSSYSVTGGWEVLQNLAIALCWNQQGRWKEVVFVRAGLQGRAHGSPLSAAGVPPSNRGSLGRAPQELFPED